MIHILEADSIQLEFGQRRILSDIYLQCQTGAISGLLGRNGQGKTCLMNIIYGTRKNDDKSVRIDRKLIPHAYLRNDLVQYLPQFHFIPDSLSLKRILADFQIDFSEFEKSFPDHRIQLKERMLDLSAGQRRLIEIFTILKSSALFVLLDEPFTHIMPVHIEKIKELILREKAGKGILLTDHLHGHVTELSDQLYLLDNGKTWRMNAKEELYDRGYLPA